MCVCIHTHTYTHTFGKREAERERGIYIYGKRQREEREREEGQKQVNRKIIIEKERIWILILHFCGKQSVAETQIVQLDYEILWVILSSVRLLIEAR